MDLLRVNYQIVDLLNVFREEMIYFKEIGNSFSIKNTLPALCPHMEDAYRQLKGPKDGNEAMIYYEKLSEDDLEMSKDIRNGLLKYCELDTRAMYEMEMKLREYLES